MPTATSPQAHTILQLMLARRLFIGDEIRIATLRSGWTESGYAADAFGEAISLLKQQGLIRVATSKAGPVAQITKEGFATGSQPRIERRQTQQPSAVAPPARRRRVEHLPTSPLASPLPITSETANSPTTPAAAPEQPAKTRTKIAAQAKPAKPIEEPDAADRQNVTHDGVFQTRRRAASSNALQLCLLGMMRNRRMRPNAQIDYAEILQEWISMGLRHDDLLLAVKRLSERNEVRAISQPQEKLMLTKSGHDRYESAPKDLNDGMDRWQAKKLLRSTKRLGAMPAA